MLGRPNIKVTYTMDLSPPTIQGAWWYLDAQQLAGLSNDMRSRWAHVVRIMETDCGVQRVGNPCTFCATHNYECWVYTDLAQGKISNARDACARCRINRHAGGCSVSKTGKRQPKTSGAAPDRRPPVLPKPSSGGGAGSSAGNALIV